ncbi:hypothetical protein [Mariniplasma anaerobium]|uniref:Uncharacterized protein n=1 Tax=Mariniplasma anaerobium TaxID=2735436 RepID=A0A7U9XVU3_9MOLU|nr:hypothetical protein [Mariniplasma anaerobium]BCR36745.1 hypothetical protein MPAN_016380 [Mariniplasma anaerobium]
MVRKIATPVLFILFGILIYFLESSVINLPVDSDGVSHNGVNLFNKILFLVVLVLLLIFEVRIQFNKIKNIYYKYLYLMIMVLSLSSITYFFISYFIWK